MRNSMIFWMRNAALILACSSYTGCGDDDASPDASIADAAAGSGGSGGAAGSSDAGAGAGGANGGTGTGGASAAACTEPAPTEPVVCGGQTCTAPTFEMNACIVACCIDVSGVATCGAKSTSAEFPAECTLPPVADSACPLISAVVDAQGTVAMLDGCCNTELDKCGVVSPYRPGCITQSVLFPLPDPLLSCDGSVDAGAEDAGQ